MFIIQLGIIPVCPTLAYYNFTSFIQPHGKIVAPSKRKKNTRKTNKHCFNFLRSLAQLFGGWVYLNSLLISRAGPPLQFTLESGLRFPVSAVCKKQKPHHHQEVPLAQFSLYLHKSGLKLDSFHLLISKKKCCPNRVFSEHSVRRELCACPNEMNRILGHLCAHIGCVHDQKYEMLTY